MFLPLVPWQRSALVPVFLTLKFSSLMIKRHFLGWDQPVSVKVAEFLLAGRTGGAVDLGETLVLVPTRQAGRRLRQLLIKRAAEGGAGLFPPEIETPTILVAPRPEKERPVASASEELCCWIRVLRQADLSAFAALFPLLPANGDFGWALHTARMLRSLRSTLVEGGWLLEDVAGLGEAQLAEAERWQDLAALERLYTVELGRLGRSDCCRLQREAAGLPCRIEQWRRIVVAAVPDPMPLAVKALEKASRSVAIDILVHAPAEKNALFDQWGRPLAEAWRQYGLDIEEPDRRIVLCATAGGQCRKAIELLADEQDCYSCAATGIGVADPVLAAPLVRHLRENGLAAYDPAGVRMKDHSLYRLLVGLGALLIDRSFAALANFLRHADLLAWLARERKVPVVRLLSGLDRLQNFFLPQTAEAAFAVLERLTASAATRAAITEAFTAVRKFLAGFADAPFSQALEAVLVEIYGGRSVDPRHREDRDFSKAAARVRSLLEEFGVAAGQMSEFSPAERMQLFLDRLAELSFYPDHDDAAIELDGWLELPWLDTPLLVVCGMNEGAVPTSSSADPFLPDSLRKKLGIRCNDSLLARDVYLLAGLTESRRRAGRLYLLAGKFSSRGEPLMPSRLFFQCADRQLADRAARLFKSVEEPSATVMRSIGFQLDPDQAERKHRRIEHLPVTAFADYLKCPFRFFLRHVLGMEATNDLKSEMDALDFGSLAHGALELLGRDDGLRRAENPVIIAAALVDDLQRRARNRFGSSPPLQITIQLTSLCSRLEHAAVLHAAMVADGWRIVEVEMERSITVDNVVVRGRIDRLDRHRETGRFRIIDYKVGEKARMPDKVHLGAPNERTREYALIEEDGKVRCWQDLQLPLYYLLLAGDGIGLANCEAGYFNLPKAVSETDYTPMPAFFQASLASAERCMLGVLADIGSGRFWPPVPSGKFDDFGDLFCEEATLLFKEPTNG